MKKVHIANVLRSNNGNKMKSARMLKINVKTLYNLIKSLGITIDRLRSWHPPSVVKNEREVGGSEIPEVELKVHRYVTS